MLRVMWLCWKSTARTEAESCSSSPSSSFHTVMQDKQQETPRGWLLRSESAPQKQTGAGLMQPLNRGRSDKLLVGQILRLSAFTLGTARGSQPVLVACSMEIWHEI